jgi:uncharacterized membrane protein HdeD (DUF308 family)
MGTHGPAGTARQVRPVALRRGGLPAGWLYAVRHIIVSVVALALLIGIYWVAYGIAQIYAAIANRELPHRGWMGFIGALSVAAGIIVIVWPGPSLVTLALVLGIWLIIYGIMEITLAFRVRSAISHVRHAVTSPA